MSNVEIGTYHDGPLQVTGGVILSDDVGGRRSLENPTIARCRCGRSNHPPFDDGSRAGTRPLLLPGGRLAARRLAMARHVSDR